MTAPEIFQGLGIALGLGLLVGSQREIADPSIAGVRTFALITMAGALAAALSDQAGPWIIPLMFAGVVAMVVVGNLTERRHSAGHSGITTEIAAIVMFAVGAMCILGPREVAVVIAGVVFVLLHLKLRLQRFLASLTAGEMTAIAQFVLVSLVILPILPDRTFGPYDVLNPRQIWWMVILVVGLSLAGYLALRFAGKKTGIPLAGLLGGLVSSTATTASQARLARSSNAVAPACAVIMLASTVVYARILVMIGITAPTLITAAAAPIGIVGGVAALLAIAAWRQARSSTEEIPRQSNPTELKSALTFGAIYAVVLLAAAAARDHFGNQGLYATAIISGLTDMDAITLSTSRLVSNGSVDTGTAWRVILIASMSNTVFKGAMVGVLAGRPLLRRVGLLYGMALAASALVLAFWP